MSFVADPPPATGIRSPGLAPGTYAPAFAVPATPRGQRMFSDDLRGSTAVLVFYPADFTPVCTGELSIFNELLPDLGSFGARVYGVSVDGLWSHQAFADQLRLQFPLLSDFHPKGELSRSFGVYRDEEGLSERAVFVLDRDGRVHWSEVVPIETSPGVEGALRAVEELYRRDAGAEARP